MVSTCRTPDTAATKLYPDLQSRAKVLMRLQGVGTIQEKVTVGFCRSSTAASNFFAAMGSTCCTGVGNSDFRFSAQTPLGCWGRCLKVAEISAEEVD